MRLSTKGRYALEALVYMGYKSIEPINISLTTISDGTNLSVRYLEQLFRDLKKADIIDSRKGKNGGYRFAKPLSEITVGDIFRATEGTLTPVKCISGEYCERANNCIARDLWVDIYDEINDVMDNITIESLVQNYKREINGITL